MLLRTHVLLSVVCLGQQRSEKNLRREWGGVWHVACSVSGMAETGLGCGR